MVKSWNQRDDEAENRSGQDRAGQDKKRQGGAIEDGTGLDRTGQDRSSPVPLPDLYFHSFFYPVAPIVSSAGGII